MLFLFGGALLAGTAASLAIPFAPFAVALAVAIGVGAGWAGLHGTGLGRVLLSAVALLVSTQVGYGLGLIATAVAEGARQTLRRPPAPKSVPATLSDLHIGEKP